MTEEPSPRRKLLLGIGTGLTTAFAGCSSLGGQNSQTEGDNDTQSTRLKTEPEDSDYVENGEMTVGPRLAVHSIENISKTSLSINFRALPNPLADYEIEVYFTPTSKVPTEWDYGTTRMKADEVYDESNHRWVIPQEQRFKNNGEGSRRDSCYTLFAKEHGEKIGSFTVPSGAAGMVSKDVSPPDGLTAQELDVPTGGDHAGIPNMVRRGYIQEGYTDWYASLPSVGDKYRDRLYKRQQRYQEEGRLRIPGKRIISQDEAVGVYTTDIHPEIIRRLYPYQKNIELDKEIPDVEPGVFTFTWTEQPTVSPRAGDVIDQTEQFVRVGDEIHVPSRLGHGSEFLPRREKPIIEDIDTQHFQEYFTQEPERPHFHTKVDDSGDGNTVKHWRTSDYGRHSPELQEIAKMNKKKDSDETRAFRFAGQVPPHLIHGNVQNMWGIEYTIPDSVAQEAQEIGQEVRARSSGSTDAFKSMYEDSRILQHEKLQEVAQKLRNVCDNIGAESKPAQLRVVADFVQYLPHGYSDYDGNNGRLGDMSDIPTNGLFVDPGNGGSHPVWTLYSCVGDCEDFTALYNAIVSTEHFDVNEVDTAMLTGLTAYNQGGSITAHTTPGVPLDELGVDEILTIPGNAEVAEENGISQYYIPCTYEHDGKEYAYIETSSMAPLGMVTGRDAQFLQALPPASLDTF